MKNKIIKILTLSAVLVLSLCFVLACEKGNINNNGDNVQTHTHNYTASVVYPTCIDDGSAICTCTCGESYGVVIPALNHVEVKDNKVEPTCTEDGLTEGSHCSRCGETFVKQEEIEALGHTYENSNQCSVCGYVDTRYFTFTFLLKGTYSIKAADVNNIPAHVVIPSTYNGEAVTSIGYEAFYGCTGLTSVVIPDSVTEIGDRAFLTCTSLTSVFIPDSVTSIGRYAFSDCISLQFNVHNNVKYLASKTNNYFAVIGSVNTNLSSITIHNDAKIIANHAFYYDTRLTSVVIPDSVTSIGEDAFSYCSSLTSVVIGDSVTSIGDYAFSYCSSLTSVVIGDSVTTIGAEAFRACYNLTSVVIPDSVTSIGDYAFYYCSSLTSIKYSGTQTQWDKITKGTNWNSNTGYYTITYNYTGK